MKLEPCLNMLEIALIECYLMIVTVLTGAVDKGNEKKAQMCAHHQPRSQVLSSSALPERETSLGERQDEGPGNEVGTSHQFLRTSCTQGEAGYIWAIKVCVVPKDMVVSILTILSLIGLVFTRKS